MSHDPSEIYNNKRSVVSKAGTQIKRFLKRCTGNFDTNIPCRGCGHSIIDHATERDPKAWLTWSSQSIDVRAFAIYKHGLTMPGILHEFYCDHCGQVYHQKVVMGALGYVPLELISE